MTSILVIEDEHLQKELLTTILKDAGYNVFSASSLEEARKIISQYHPEIILTDLKLQNEDGMDILNDLPEEPFKPAVIIITAFGSIPSAVEAIKKGAFDYLTKPINKEVLLLTIKRAEEKINLVKEVYRLKSELYEKFKIDGVVGKSKKCFKLLK